MAELKIVKADHAVSDKWDAFVAESANGTLFHSNKFLQYHGGRFRDQLHDVVFENSGNLQAVMPMAVFDDNGVKTARSPYGASYGGIVTKYTPSYSDSRNLVQKLVEYLRDNEITQLTVTPPINVCDKVHTDTLLFAYLEQGFRISNSDISSVVSLFNEDVENELFTSRARNMARKADKSGVTARFRADVDSFWALMEKTFSKHGATPTHSKSEWEWLCSRLPHDVWCDVAYIGDTPVAGVGHIKINDLVDSSFYLCSDPEYQNSQALTFLVYQTLLQSRKSGFRFFDFGTSTVNMVARENIFRFKESFGAVGVFRHTLRIEL